MAKGREGVFQTLAS